MRPVPTALPTAPPRRIQLGRSLTYLVVTGATALAGFTAPGASAATAAGLVSDPASLVNPFIGTSNSADDFPGADSPFGMIQWSPDTPSRPDGGGYSYGDSSITGFSLTHLSGPGCGGEGDVPVLPTTGSINTSATEGFSHANESANAGYYSVTGNDGIKTELTTTMRTGMARFTFPATTQANLIFKLTGSQNGDTNTQFNVVSSSEVSGQITSGHFCGAGVTYTLYFDMQFDRSFSANGTAAVSATLAGPSTGATSPNTAEPKNHPTLHGKLPAASSGKSTTKPNLATPNASANNGYVTFNTTSNQVVQAKVGVSFVSIANAKADIAAENPNFNFSATQSAAHSAWNSLLGKIDVAGGTASQQTVFYTALYHALIHPNVISDSNGQYLGVDGAVHTVGSGHSAEYSNFSGWDIYRTQAQLSALVDPSVASDIAQSMVDDYAAGGMFPKWMNNNGETYVMVGDPAASIIADYYAFGARNFDTSTALHDLVAEADSTNNIRPGNNYVANLGYVPSNGSEGCCNFYGPASTSLEYDSANFALSAFAGALGDTTDQTALANRAQNWRNLFNPASGYIQPRDSNGQWTGGFDPTSGTNFVEGDSWQYTPMVPFNLAGLITAKGGDAAMNSYLNTDLSQLTGGNGYADLSNEPSLDIPWEYDYSGQPYNTQKIVRQVQDQIWTDAPGGLAGNDDLGTMSAWYVWSAIGMYPETPGTADLALGSPLFTQIVLSLPSGNTLTINAPAAADNAPYVQSAAWNGAAWNNAYLPAGALSSGGTFAYTLGTSANTGWASGAGSAPPSYGGSGPQYTDVGVSNDNASTGADFDGVGYSYSATALANAGVTPGSTITAGGSTFTWPNVAPAALYSAKPDNYEAVGQTIPATGSGSIAFLGSATNGPSSGNATVTYTDGSTSTVSLGFSDWTLNGGSASVEAGNTIAVTTAYRNAASGTADQTKTYVFATTPVSLASGKTVASVTLPDTANQGALHVFAIAFGGSGGTGAPTGPIVSGVSSSLCVDDNHSGTTNGTAIQIWTCNGTGAQNWTVEPNGTLQVLGGCMDVTGGGTTSGTKVQYYQCNGTGAQQWQPQSNGSLLNPQSGLCLDDPGSSTTSGTQLQIYTCNGTNAQKWTLP
jgi:predicted alpha-1,2-mannosidase